MRSILLAAAIAVAPLVGCAGAVSMPESPSSVTIGAKADDGRGASGEDAIRYAALNVPTAGAPAYVDATAPDELAFTITAMDTELLGTGGEVSVKGEHFVEVTNAGGVRGWVDDKNLTEAVDPDRFCADARAWDVLASLRDAVVKKDAAGFNALVSSRHGLTVRLTPGGDGMHVEGDAWSAFGVSVAWGPNAANGQPVEGSFDDLALAELTDVIAGESQDLRCNRYPQGAGAYDADIPVGLVNLNFVTVSVLYDGNWLTWAVGYDYVNQVPRVAYLIRLGLGDGN